MRPDRVVLVCGTGTEVGKTWVGSRLLVELRRRGLVVAARKPAQSFDVGEAGTPEGGPTDAEVLGAASGEPADAVCRASRWYGRAMAPPMAAEALGLDPFTVADLVGELAWPGHPVDVGVVETAGGVRSPQASDGDVLDVAAVLQPEVVVLVADAGLGTINGVRLAVDALVPVLAGAGPGRPVVVLNRFDAASELHQRNREWLGTRDGLDVVTTPGGEDGLAAAVLGGLSAPGPRRRPLPG